MVNNIIINITNKINEEAANKIVWLYSELEDSLGQNEKLLLIKLKECDAEDHLSGMNTNGSTNEKVIVIHKFG